MYYRPVRFNLLPEVIKNLLIINGIFFFATFSFKNTFGLDLNEILGLYLPGSQQFRPYQLVTHMFMHGNFGHIFFNMFALWMFGTSIENYWGGKKFLIYYFFTGLGAAVLHLGVNYWEMMKLESILRASGFDDLSLAMLRTGEIHQGLSIAVPRDILQQYYLKFNIPTVGASGAVFGVLLAFGMMFPNQYIFIYFLFPIKAKYFVMIYGALELINGLSNDPSSNIAHFAHLGGMLFGFILIKYWQNKEDRYYY
ncbi:rhomboid family intramembrane serine protease [Schleiferia thermophila]|jgi:membrane associated rhomboid family serine protease|uniref:Membrane associated rhomboid family serine protease n=1 Tax=Schleiferia thermophila TaxID=884107 RepID=A0A369A7F8_9FLAO|nr:rhomboid family intramembrane serine protease [Schleiferia thermophila]KFD39895.1 membrane protein [Schleiferia thermophila str. Yellowstone]RCX05290.1 membrane associated rhomboid family serine protease [Schleiferia thermophila]GCD79200.1 rhomboid family intramembrane serine protease [Schleiferia thermophila]